MDSIQDDRVPNAIDIAVNEIVVLTVKIAVRSSQYGSS